MPPQSTFKVVESVDRSLLVDLYGLLHEPHSLVILGLISPNRPLLHLFFLFHDQMTLLLSLFQNLRQSLRSILTRHIIDLLIFPLSILDFNIHHPASPSPPGRPRCRTTHPGLSQLPQGALAASWLALLGSNSSLGCTLLWLT